MIIGDLGDMFQRIEAEIGAPINFIDGFRLSQYDADDGLEYTVGEICKQFNFFAISPEKFHYIQNGEFVSFESLDPQKHFWAIEKMSSGVSPISGKRLHELHYYRCNK